MSLTRRQPTPPAVRAITRWQAVPRSGLWFAPHQLLGCLVPAVVFPAVVVALPALLWALS
jgi:hypothetical protein